MITFCRGLVLRSGERQLEFERDLGDGRVQFKYLDNFEVCTFRMSKLYQDILDRRYIPAHVPAPGEVPAEALQKPLPSVLTDQQQALIAFRMHFVRALEEDAKSAPRTRTRRALICQKIWDAWCVDGKGASTHRVFKKPSVAAVEVWLRKFRESDANPYVLLDRRAFVVRPKRFDRSVEMLVDNALVKYYLKPRGVSVRKVHWLIEQQIKKQNEQQGSNLAPPSESTIQRRVRSIPPYVCDLKRLGVGYARNKWRYSLKGDQSTRILECVEIDHTLLDIWVLDPRTGIPLGRPWITLVIDRFSGYLLGLYISFYGPSVATVASAIKESIRPKDAYIDLLHSPQLPWTAMGCAECYVVDNGLEFHSKQFQRIAWELRSDLIYNPVRSPWYKSSIERAIMESNRALPLHGKVHRPLANAARIDPAKSAAVMFDDLCTCLVEWASQVHPLHIHPKTLVRPLDLWEDGRASMPPPTLPQDLTGLELICGLGAQRRVDGDGVFFNYLRFNSVELQDYRRNHGSALRTEIRFNPEDLKQIFVQLPKARSWLTVPLQKSLFAWDLPMSLMQLQVLRAEAGRKLTKANAPEMLNSALVSLSERWQEATRRGVHKRKSKALTRLQGMTSVPLATASADAPTSSLTPPIEISSVMYEALPEVIPFKTFSLDED
jgi:putative transposase